MTYRRFSEKPAINPSSAKSRPVVKSSGKYTKFSSRNSHKCPATSGYIEFLLQDKYVIGKVIAFNLQTGKIQATYKNNIYAVSDYRPIQAKTVHLPSGEAVHVEKLTRKQKTEVAESSKRDRIVIKDGKLYAKNKRDLSVTPLITKERKAAREEADEITYEYNVLGWIKKAVRRGEKVAFISYENWNELRRRVETEADLCEIYRLSGFVILRLSDIFNLVTSGKIVNAVVSLVQEDHLTYQVEVSLV